MDNAATKHEEGNSIEYEMKSLVQIHFKVFVYCLRRRIEVTAQCLSQTTFKKWSVYNYVKITHNMYDFDPIETSAKYLFLQTC